MERERASERARVKERALGGARDRETEREGGRHALGSRQLAGVGIGEGGRGLC